MFSSVVDVLQQFLHSCSLYLLISTCQTLVLLSGFGLVTAVIRFGNKKVAQLSPSFRKFLHRVVESLFLVLQSPIFIGTAKWMQRGWFQQWSGPGI